MHPIEPEQMSRALERTRERGVSGVVICTREAGIEAHALDFFEAKSHSPASAHNPLTESEFYWSTEERGWVVTMGHTRSTRALDGREDLRSLSATRRAWREDVVLGEAADALVLGGQAFDERAPTTEAWSEAWRDWGTTNLWMPAFAAWAAPGAPARVTWTMEIGPDDTLEALMERAQVHDEIVDAWLDGVSVRARRPSSTDRVGEVVEPNVDRWSELVDEAAARLAASDLDKVVLARPIRYALGAMPNVRDLLERAEHTYPTCATFAVRPPRSGERAANVFVGATPEVLARVSAGRVYVDALAGTCSTCTSDEELLASQKDRREHQHVVDFIAEALSPAATLSIPAQPFVDRLSNVKHLRTPISGELGGDEDVFSVGARLHPTPAVCGRPRQMARGHILEAEGQLGFERGWYAGALGWSTLEGDGELDVALRCALLDESGAHVFVGAGIMAASTGASEVEETRLKARAMLGALGGLE